MPDISTSSHFPYIMIQQSMHPNCTSASFKSVLPALYSHDLALDYHNLDGVHNGGEAMVIFPKIKGMPPEEQKIARHNLLKYRELDTYAMVKVWEKLADAAE